MARRSIDHNDPRQIAVQISIRMPYWYREQLADEARQSGVSLPQLALDAIERVYVPKPLK